MLCLVKRLLRAQHDKQVSFRKICFLSKDHEQTVGYTDDEMYGLILPVRVECMVIARWFVRFVYRAFSGQLLAWTEIPGNGEREELYLTLHCHQQNYFCINPFTAMMTHKNDLSKLRNLNPLTLFVFFFALAYERILIKTRSTESLCVVGPDNILFAGASVHFSVQKFYRLGQ